MATAIWPVNLSVLGITLIHHCFSKIQKDHGISALWLRWTLSETSFPRRSLIQSLATQCFLRFEVVNPALPFVLCLGIGCHPQGQVGPVTGLGVWEESVNWSGWWVSLVVWLVVVWDVAVGPSKGSRQAKRPKITLFLGLEKNWRRETN
jgi:hypothetical protein